MFHAPLDDHPRPLTNEEWATVFGAVDFVVTSVSSGRPTLVTCAAGLNRSGIIDACAVSILTGRSGKSSVKIVQRHRDGALVNKSFVTQIEELLP